MCSRCPNPLATRPRKWEDTSLSLLTSTLIDSEGPPCARLANHGRPDPSSGEKPNAVGSLSSGDLWIANQIVLDMPSSGQEPLPTSWPGVSTPVRPTRCHCPKTMAKRAIADAASWYLRHPVSHATLHLARLVDCTRRTRWDEGPG